MGRLLFWPGGMLGLVPRLLRTLQTGGQRFSFFAVIKSRYFPNPGCWRSIHNPLYQKCHSITIVCRQLKQSIGSAVPTLKPKFILSLATWHRSNQSESVWHPSKEKYQRWIIWSTMQVPTSVFYCYYFDQSLFSQVQNSVWCILILLAIFFQI